MGQNNTSIPSVFPVFTILAAIGGLLVIFINLGGCFENIQTAALTLLALFVIYCLFTTAFFALRNEIFVHKESQFELKKTRTKTWQLILAPLAIAAIGGFIFKHPEYKIEGEWISEMPYTYLSKYSDIPVRNPDFDFRSAVIWGLGAFAVIKVYQTVVAKLNLNQTA